MIDDLTNFAFENLNVAQLVLIGDHINLKAETDCFEEN